MSSTISNDEKKAITAINRALKASDKKLAQATIKVAKAQLKDTSNARKAISKALNAKDKKLAKEVAASAKKYLKELTKDLERMNLAISKAKKAEEKYNTKYNIKQNIKEDTVHALILNDKAMEEAIKSCPLGKVKFLDYEDHVDPCEFPASTLVFNMTDASYDDVFNFVYDCGWLVSECDDVEARIENGEDMIYIIVPDLQRGTKRGTINTIFGLNYDD